MILLLDNYDSFTYNLAQFLGQLGEKLEVHRNDQITLDQIAAKKPQRIVISPGPGTPEDSGICVDVIRRFSGQIPILGVCLGHQAIGLVFGGNVVQSPAILHGKESLVFHNRKNLFKGMPLPFQAGRYHSLAVVGGNLELEAETADGIAMGVKHPMYPVFGVQFHPESILTPEGKTFLENFVKLCTKQAFDKTSKAENEL